MPLEANRKSQLEGKSLFSSGEVSLGGQVFLERAVEPKEACKEACNTRQELKEGHRASNVSHDWPHAGGVEHVVASCSSARASGMGKSNAGHKHLVHCESSLSTNSERMQADLQTLVLQVKALQRLSKHNADSWRQHCLEAGVMIAVRAGVRCNAGLDNNKVRRRSWRACRAEGNRWLASMGRRLGLLRGGGGRL